MQELDFRILDWIQANLRCPALDFVVPLITHLGDAGIFWILLAVLLLLSRKKDLQLVGLRMGGGLLAMLVLSNIMLKNIVGRSRPCWLRPLEDMLIAIPKDYSFPSGHTFASFLSATIIMKYNKAWGIAAYALAALIAFSRLYLYVHFPSDVVAGMVFGIGLGLLTCWVSGKLEKKVASRKEKNLENKNI